MVVSDDDDCYFDSDVDASPPIDVSMEYSSYHFDYCLDCNCSLLLLYRRQLRRVVSLVGPMVTSHVPNWRDDDVNVSLSWWMIVVVVEI